MARPADGQQHEGNIGLAGGRFESLESILVLGGDPVHALETKSLNQGLLGRLTAIASDKHQRPPLEQPGCFQHVGMRTILAGLFASFGRAVSENIGVLSEHWEERDSLAWKALEQFYRVDLQRFVDG